MPDLPKTIRENWRVVIYPKTRDKHREFRESEIEADCKHTQRLLERRTSWLFLPPHVKHIVIEHDTREVCPFCGEEWKVWTAEDAAKFRSDMITSTCPGVIECKYTAGEPMCCDAARAAWKEQSK